MKKYIMNFFKYEQTKAKIKLNISVKTPSLQVYNLNINKYFWVPK